MFHDWLIAIPARLGSERLARKPLVDLGGLPLIVRVAQNLKPLTALGAQLVVATDSAEVLTVCHEQQIPAQMTAASHQSGTDRCAEVAAAFAKPLVLNVQGDEPFVEPQALMQLMQALSARPEADLATLVAEVTDPQLAADPNAVKAVRTAQGYALYFSRAAIPYDRSRRLPAHSGPQEGERFWHHIGVYAYRLGRLQEFVRLPPSPLELTEKLEQLRALEAGWRIWLEATAPGARGIDTPQDLEAARARFSS